MALSKIKSTSLETDATNLVLLSSQTASSVGTINFDNTLITSTYNNYLLLAHDVKPATDQVDAYIAISVDNGSNLRTPAYSGRTFARITNSTTSGDEQNTISSGYAQIATDLGNDGCGSFQLWLYGINEVTSGNNKFFNSTYTAKHYNDDYTWDTGMVYLTDTSNPINYLRFLFSSGNITTGKFKLYGIK